MNASDVHKEVTLMKSSKLALSLFFINLISKSAFANSPLDGFYAELQGGGLIMNGSKIKSQVIAEDYFEPAGSPFGFVTTEDSQFLNAADTSGIGEINLGFGHQLGAYPVYFGGEFFASEANRGINNNLDTTRRAVITFLPEDSLNVKLSTENNFQLRDFEYGISLKAGILLTPSTLLYGVVGEAVNQLELKPANSFSQNSPVLNLDSNLVTETSAQTSKSVNGLRLGGGIEKYIQNNFALNVNYIYTNYGRIDADSVADLNSLQPSFDPSFLRVISTPNGFRTNSKNSITSQQILLGLKYYFIPLGSSSPLTDLLFDFTGFYAGGEGGGIENIANTNSLTAASNIFLFRNPIAFDVLTNHQRANLWNGSGVGQIHFGYSLPNIPKPWYLSAEIFSDFSSHVMSMSSVASGHYEDIFQTPPPAEVSQYVVTLWTKTKIKLNDFEYGIDVKPGFYLTHSSLLYGRIGAVINKVDINSNNLLNILYPAAGSNVPTVSRLDTSFDKNTIGLRLGTGIEQYLAHNFSINMDYIFTDYGKFRTHGVGTVNSLINSPLELASATNSFISHTSTTVVSNQVLVGIKYYFGNEGITTEGH